MLNLTGLGLGYAYLGRWWRLLLHLLVTVALIVIAFVTGAATLPWVWRAVALVWIGWMALDGWRIARVYHRAPTGLPARIVPAAAAVALVGAIGAGYVLYGAAAGRAYAAGTEARDRGDCAAAIPQYDQVADVYELTLSGDVAAAGTDRRECQAFVAASDAEMRGEFGEAVRLYQEFRRDRTGTVLAPYVNANLLRTFGRWGTALRAAGDHDRAIEVYRQQLQEVGTGPGSSAVRSDLAATYVERAAELRETLATGNGTGVDPARSAVDGLLVVAREFADTPVAAAVPQALSDTYVAATSPFAGRFCDVLPVQGYFAALTDTELAAVTATANADRATSLYECGLANYGSGTWSAAIQNFDELVAAYPTHPSTAQAQSVAIAARAAEVTGSAPPALPAPYAGDNPGAIPVTLYNDNPAEVRVFVVGVTAHEIVLPGCPGCPATYPIGAPSCPTFEGRPSTTLRLQPGDYTIVGEYATANPVISPTTLENGFEYTNCLYVEQGG